MIFEKVIFLQCPCRYGRAANPLLLLAIVVGVWLMAIWIKRVFRKEGDSIMNKIGKIVIVVVLIVAVAAVVNLKRSKSEDSGAVAIEGPVEVTTTTETEGPVTARSESSKALPRLVDIGSDTCIPCKMMAPILDELKKEYAGSFKVDFLDIKTNPAFAEEYGIRLIPTQIFYDADGKERFRHEGFMSKEDILAKWAELNVELIEVK